MPPLSWFLVGLSSLTANGISAAFGAMNPCEEKILPEGLPASASHCESSS